MSAQSELEKPMAEVVVINPHIWKSSKLSREEFLRRIKCVSGIRGGEKHYDDGFDSLPSFSYFPRKLESWTLMERFHQLVNEGDFSVLDERTTYRIFALVLPAKLTSWLLNVKLATFHLQILNWLAAWTKFHRTLPDERVTSLPPGIRERVDEIRAAHYGSGFSREELWGETAETGRPTELLKHYDEVSITLTGALPPEILKLRVGDLDDVDLKSWGLEHGRWGTWPDMYFPYRYACMYERDWEAIVVRGENDKFERDAVVLWEKWLHTFTLYPKRRTHLFEVVGPAVQTGFIYLFRGNEIGHFKIGWTADEDPYARKRGLKTGSAEELIPAGHFRAASKQTETTVKNLFAAKRTRPDGEWFALSEQDVANLLDEDWRTRNNIF